MVAVERSFFHHVLDAFEGFVADVDGTLHSSAHRRGLKVWYDDATREHFEAQLIRLDGEPALEIGFHSEYPKVDMNEAVIARLAAVEPAWRAELGNEPDIGEFLGSARWRRISETWEPPDADDVEATIEVAARLADYVITLEPLRRAG